jgi:hypothetical protein
LPAVKCASVIRNTETELYLAHTENFNCINILVCFVLAFFKLMVLMFVVMQPHNQRSCLTTTHCSCNFSTCH